MSYDVNNRQTNYMMKIDDINITDRIIIMITIDAVNIIRRVIIMVLIDEEDKNTYLQEHQIDIYII